MNRDEILLEQAYHSIYEDNNPFQPASDGEIENRRKTIQQAERKQIQEYIENGSEGNLHLHQSSLLTLPSNLTTVDGSLFLEDANTTSLNDNMHITGCLFIGLSAIKKLPKNLQVDESLDMSYTAIDSIPDDLSIGDRIYLHESKLHNTHTIQQILDMYPHLEHALRYEVAFNCDEY